MAATYQQLTLDDALIAAHTEDDAEIQTYVGWIDDPYDIDLDAFLPEIEGDYEPTTVECAD